MLKPPHRIEIDLAGFYEVRDPLAEELAELRAALVVPYEAGGRAVHREEFGQLAEALATRGAGGEEARGEQLLDVRHGRGRGGGAAELEELACDVRGEQAVDHELRAGGARRRLLRLEAAEEPRQRPQAQERELVQRDLRVGGGGGVDSALLQGEVVGEDVREQHEHAAVLVHRPAQPQVATEGGETRRGLAAQPSEVLVVEEAQDLAHDLRVLLDALPRGRELGRHGEEAGDVAAHPRGEALGVVRREERGAAREGREEGLDAALATHLLGVERAGRHRLVGQLGGGGEQLAGGSGGVFKQRLVLHLHANRSNQRGVAGVLVGLERRAVPRVEETLRSDQQLNVPTIRSVRVHSALAQEVVGRLHRLEFGLTVGVLVGVVLHRQLVVRSADARLLIGSSGRK